MAKVLNVSYRKFRVNTADKNIVLWGAGKLASYYIQTFCKNLNILYIVDKNKKLWDKKLVVDSKAYSIVSEDSFLAHLENEDKLISNTAIFITPKVYAGEIIKHINTIPALDQMECYAGVLMCDHNDKCEFTFQKGREKIPRKIHYCWFGKKDIPDHLKRYMDSWHKFCPDYEIIRWDETNYDISKNNYMREAYNCRMWGFVPDYARLDIIYNEGGVYLDTDVELLAPLDKLLNDEMFCGFVCNFRINFGCGFGAVRRHPLIKELRDYYDNVSFYYNDGEMNLKACYEYQHPVLKSYGFRLENSFQKKDGVVLYPSEVLAPSMGLVFDNFTKNTVAVHHGEYSWAEENEKKAYESFKKELRNGAIGMNIQYGNEDMEFNKKSSSVGENAFLIH